MTGALQGDPQDPVVAGARIRARGMERLRLGMPVLLRVDEDGRAVLDWQAMCARWGIGFAEPAQRPLRSAPVVSARDMYLSLPCSLDLTFVPGRYAWLDPEVAADPALLADL